jgi:hypothetical protein
MPEHRMDDDEPAGGAPAEGGVSGADQGAGAGADSAAAAHPSATPDASSRRAWGQAAQGAALDAMTELLREQARGWARQLRVLQELDDLAVLGAAAGRAQFPQLEMAGSWQVSQLTASRWMWEAQRFAEALPCAFAMLSRGELLEHQARVLLHRTRSCPVELARAVEAQVLPAGAEQCPADLGRRVERLVLRLQAEQDREAAAQRQADAAAQRRTFGTALPDGMGMAGGP